jgi:hypothetical protein
MLCACAAVLPAGLQAHLSAAAAAAAVKQQHWQHNQHYQRHSGRQQQQQQQACNPVGVDRGILFCDWR